MIVKGQGADHNLYFNQLTLGQAPVGWQTAAGLQTDVAPGASSAGNVSVLVAKQDGTGRIFYNWSELGGAGSGWVELPGLLTDAAPAAALIGTDAHGGRLSPPYLFVIVKGQGADHNLYFNQLTLGQAPVGWQTAAGLQTDVAPEASSAGNVSVLVAKQSWDGPHLR